VGVFVGGASVAVGVCVGVWVGSGCPVGIGVKVAGGGGWFVATAVDVALLVGVLEGTEVAV